MPGINDDEMPGLIEFALNVGAGKRWPPLGIQKLSTTGWADHGKDKAENWWHFYNRSIKSWEEQLSVPLLLKAQDFGIEKRPTIPTVLRRRRRPGGDQGTGLGAG